MRFSKAKFIHDGEPWLAIATPDAEEWAARISEKTDWQAEIKPYSEKRSLDSNSYLWVLIGKIADMMRADKDTVYLIMLKRYGQGGVLKVPDRHYEKFMATYKYAEPHESLEEDDVKYVRFWVGSSQYNQAEMSILLDGVIGEAQELGIETLTPQEIALLKANWKGEQE